MRTPRQPEDGKRDAGSNGWGHTHGWSKKVHIFEEGRAHCSGSPSREGESLMQNPPAELARGESICKDCATYAARARNSYQSQCQRGVARTGQPARRYMPRATAKLYRETAYA